MSAPAPRRRSRSYDHRQHWKQKSLFIPVGLGAKLTEAARASGKDEKSIIIEALEKKLSPGGSKSSDDSGNR